ncbi:hypothetical protein BCR44DRAFT_311321 [Catenaria anguillulae PL171]|uniref:Uncharacterized protein n=1 Tax=Catenaria anguillulae PL171 TaxID=765915 RepID=A0A1Y2HV07_9FUNG|nr:hypothetical protein BCR44DRAFT_311321 [Catenaria anguillulae PL171]
MADPSRGCESTTERHPATWQSHPAHPKLPIATDQPNAFVDQAKKERIFDTRSRMTRRRYCVF